jgi:hypothetical protein
MESSLSQTVFLEGLLSELFECLSGRRIIVIETAECSPISIDESWSFVSFAPVGEVGFSYLGSGAAGDIVLNEAGLTSISKIIGIQTRRTAGFTLLRPMHQRLYRVYEDRNSGSLEKIGDVQIAVSGREIKCLYGRYNKPIHTKWMKLRVDVVAIMARNVGHIYCGKRIPSAVFLVVNNEKVMEVKMDTDGEMISFEKKQSIDLDDDIQLEVSLGAISISLEELLRLREGSNITVQIQRKLTGYLGLGADSFAEVELHFGESAMAIEVKNILL